jgi:hypothetical protein
MAVTSWTGFSQYGESSDDWTDPENATSMTFGWAGLDARNETEDYYTFEIVDGVPENATIDGIELQMYVKTSKATDEMTVRLSNNDGANYNLGSSFSNDITSSTGEWITYGGATELWGLDWEANDFRYTTQQMRAQFRGTVVNTKTEVFYIQFRVHYTPLPPSTGEFRINIGDAWKYVDSLKINIGDEWKAITSGAKINIGDTWKTIW